MNENIPVVMRTFKEKDIDQILEIEAGAFPKTPYSKELFIGYSNKSSHQFVVLESGKHLVGYILFSMNGHIISTAVKEAHRGKGFGRMLFTYALNHTEKGLWLEVRSKNDAAIKFYESMGMKKIGKTRNYYGDDDALILVSEEKREER